MSTVHSVPAGDLILSCEPWVWSFQYSSYKCFCANCFQYSVDLQACSNCKLYRFCDKQCQTANWKKEHKHECDMLKKLNRNLLPIQARIEEDLERIERDQKARVEQEFLRDYTGTGRLAGEILIAKIINKIERGGKDDLHDGKGSVIAMEILDLLPYDPAYDEMCKLPGPDIRSLAWPPAAVAQIPNFEELVKKVYYNVLPIYEQREKDIGGLFAVALFPQALHRHMTAVCSDINVTMTLHKRTLVLHATEDIPHYTGFRDLRHNELLGNDFIQPVKHRRVAFHAIYSKDCSCGRCTDEHDAEINPLKCVTTGCMERIPSDQRATEPCPQCGAINTARLMEYQELIHTTESIMVTSYPDIMASAALHHQLLASGDADVVHVDAQCRFILGYDQLCDLKEAGRYEEAWEMYGWMIPLICNIHPKYHLARAYWLLQGGQVGYDMMAAGGDQIARRTTSVVAKAVEWLEEAQGIYETLSGKGSKWEREAQRLLNALGHLRH